jgi:hypothetical protein
MPSGPDVSTIVEEKLQRATDELDSFALSLGLPSQLAPAVENEAKELLDLDGAGLRRLSASDCSEGAFLLIRFSMHLQNAMNREGARTTWAKGARLPQPSSMTPRQQGFALAIEAQRLKAQLRIDRIIYLSGKVEAMARALMGLSAAKRGKND